MSTVAIWSIVLCVGPYIRKISQTNDTIADSVFKKGQIFLLSYGIFGAVFYLAFIKGDSHSAKKALGFLSILIVIPIVMFAGFNPSFTTVINAEIIAMGYKMFGAILIIYYLLLLFSDIRPPGPEETLKREGEKMAQDARGDVR